MVYYKSILQKLKINSNGSRDKGSRFLWPFELPWAADGIFILPILHQISGAVTDKSRWGVGGQYQIPYTLLSSPMISSTTI